MTKLSSRSENISESVISANIGKYNELKSQGVEIISLGSGEPDFDTPYHIQNAAIKAIQQGETRYTAVDGTPSLKKSIVDKFKRENNLEFSLGEVMASSGGKQVFYNLCQALLNEGDEVIIPTPHWVSYPDIVKLAGANPIFIQTGIVNNFKITSGQLSDAINEKTRLLVINSPSNPTGAVYSKSELRDLADILRVNPHVFVISDDIYEHILWGFSKFINILNVAPELRDRTLILNGVSKAYAMTGWRIGYAAGPKDVINAMKKIQGQSTSNPCSISQVAAEEALNGDQSSVASMTRAFQERHDYLLSELSQIEGVECSKSDGAFYLFPYIKNLLTRKGMKNDIEFANFCLDEFNISVVPGSAFGSPDYIRLSFATSMNELKSAIEKLKTL
jgi:aspartate aminotransferase